MAMMQCAVCDFFFSLPPFELLQSAFEYWAGLVLGLSKSDRQGDQDQQNYYIILKVQGGTGNPVTPACQEPALPLPLPKGGGFESEEEV